jgi:hypothetical protein
MYDPASCRMLFRCQAALVIITLLATPLALLARSFAGNISECNEMCCLPHGGHSMPMHKPQHGGIFCNYAAGGHMALCVMNSGHQTDDTLAAPMAPTAPSPRARITTPDGSRKTLTKYMEFALSGFLPNHFQPPRS